MNANNISKVVSLSGLILLLSSCGGNPPEQPPKAQEAPEAGKSTKLSEGGPGATDTTLKTPPVIKNGIVLKPDEMFPLVSASAHLEKLPENIAVCTVDDAPVSIDEYRRQFKAQQQQMQAALSVNQNTVVQLLALAHKNGVSLTSAEHDKLIKTAHQTEALDKKKFAQFLAENKMTAKAFDDQVLDVGLAAKMGNQLIEKSLLPEIVNRQMLADAARKDGLSKQAMNKYIEIKATEDYKKMQKATGFSDQELEDEIVKNQLSQLMVEKIEKASPLTDTEMRKFYDENKEKLKHGDRIRISQIVIAAPKAHIPNVPSLKEIIQKSDPKLSETALDQKVAEEKEKRKAKAEGILDQIKKGADFTKLANENTEDPAVKELHNGGDTGWQEKAALEPTLVEACNHLEINQVDPQLVVSPYGFHILKLTGKEPAGLVPYDEVKDRLKQVMGPRHDDEVIKKWLAERRKQVKIVFSPEFEAAVYGPKGANKTATTTESKEAAAKRQVH